jgi:glutaredoxin-related protein
MNDDTIKAQAIEYAKRNKKQIAEKLIDANKYQPDDVPISIFMCGSPGAGKTEFSKNVIAILEANLGNHIIRIDGDEIRTELPGYTGTNSYLFQPAISIIVDKMHDIVLKKRHNFLLDGTFSKYEKAKDNITRSLNRGRKVYIFYIYQDPLTAWRFTEKREALEGRNIPKESFIQQFFGAKDTINRISLEFGDQVTIYFVKKDFELNTVEDTQEIKANSTTVDTFIEKQYTEQELTELL